MSVEPITGVPENYPMVTARYEGPTAKHSVVGLATHRNYGRKQGGDIFQVHRSDVEAFPNMFTVLATPATEPEVLPKLPSALRGPEPILRPSSIVEVPPPAPERTLGEMLEKPTVVGVPSEGEPTLDELPFRADPPNAGSFVLGEAKQKSSQAKRSHHKKKASR